MDDAVALLASLTEGAGDDVALLTLSVPDSAPDSEAAPEAGVVATAYTAATPEHLGQ
ncbi:hypothetical protein [Streptomyces sp. KN37]|uniref:hypothetical protein n=1 Tax=Streptomyces sp. KN37 TaxID=3090667 RepID=UPI002A74D4DC|nr:hypothetical protein [Streptomyces sp. KN37]WPO76168.1 hypothetical protein R9806_22165 [Streptomyces sp. KN37]